MIKILISSIDHEKRLESLKQELNLEHKEEIEYLKEENINEIKQILSDFDQSKILFKQEMSKLHQELKEAAIKYENRESREDDVQIIRDLNASIEKYRSDLLKAEDQANFYKLELCNREVNFNKIFNNSPLLSPVSGSMTALVIYTYNI
jgi:hypothetical protein